MRDVTNSDCNGGLRIKQNLLEPECLVSMERNNRSAEKNRSSDTLTRGDMQNITLQSPVGCLRRDPGLSGNGMSVRTTSGKQGVESCYYEHFILDYRLPGTNTTITKNNINNPPNNSDRLSIEPVVTMKPRKTKFPALAFFSCEDCGRCYRSKTSLGLHKRLECGKEPTFQCPYCPLKTHQKGNLNVHIKKKHLRNVPDDSPNDRSQSDGGGHIDGIQQ
ncbi:uncharacterized protein LOC142326515 [Lycorma delicatula]|uniref:uncharacterized protein LOC142326515 n=1 Tax=Lycorma delicatula TaxID=130591 RepID=UPI003F510FAA